MENSIFFAVEGSEEPRNLLNGAVKTFETNPVEFQLMSLNSEVYIIIKNGQGVGTRGYKITMCR